MSEQDQVHREQMQGYYRFAVASSMLEIERGRRRRALARVLLVTILKHCSRNVSEGW